MEVLNLYVDLQNSGAAIGSELASLFDEPLNPVAPKAQRKVIKPNLNNKSNQILSFCMLDDSLYIYINIYWYFHSQIGTDSRRIRFGFMD